MYAFSLRFRSLFFLIALFLSFCVAPLARAATEVPPVDTPDSRTLLSPTNIVANIGVYEIQVKAGQNNVYSIAFDIVNRGDIQPKVVYAVNLLKMDETNGLVVVDQKVYADDTLTLDAGQTLHKEIAYTVPNFFAGAYIFQIQLRNSDGLYFAQVNSPEISLNGVAENVLINPSSCYLTVGTDTEKHPTQQGVDVTSEETLTAHCTIKSNFKTEKSITPVFQTHYRNTFGNIVAQEKQKPVTLKPAQILEYSAIITKMTEPQAYDAVLSFTSNAGNQISSPVAFHYVLQGKSATIQNLGLNKDYYSKGDIAKLNLTWSGGAGIFPEARNKPTETKENATLSISIANDQKQLCSSNLTKLININSAGNTEHLELPITADCKNPTAEVKITDATGKILAQNSYNVLSKNAPEQKNSSMIYYIVFFVIVFFAVIAALIRFMKKKNTPEAPAVLGMFIGFLTVISIFSIAGTAKAETYSMDLYLSSYGGWAGTFTSNFTIDLNKADRTYAPGETITANGYFSANTCTNTLGGKISAEINSEKKFVVDGSYQGPHPYFITTKNTDSFTAEKKPGTYLAKFTAYYYPVNSASYIKMPWGSIFYGPRGVVVGTANIIYTVALPPTPPTVSFTANPPLVNAGGSSTFMWKTTGASSCQTIQSAPVKSTTPVARTPESLGSFIETITETTSYTFTCTGPGGTSLPKTATVTIAAKPIDCVDDTWSPPTSETCTGETMYQTSNCGNIQNVQGTAVCKNPVCGTLHNDCTRGTSNDLGDSFTQFIWQCAVGNRDITCYEDKPAPVLGKCGPANNIYSLVPPEDALLCNSGDSSAVTKSADGNNWLWTCSGQNGGAEASCTAKKAAPKYTEF